MSAVAQALTYRALFRDQNALTLLRTDHAPLTLGLLGAHLGGDVRTLPAADLYDLLDEDLDELRLRGIDMPRTSQQYCATWVRDGFLTRRAHREARTEEFSLTEDAHRALRLLDQVSTPRDAVTRSRLSLLTDRLLQLARDTDEDPATAISALRAEQRRISEEIATVERDGVTPMSTAQAVEAANELFALALDVPSDFERVRSELDRLHKQLRVDLIEHDGPQGEILDQLFLGVDAIEQSDAGQSFTAFHSLLIDPVQEARFYNSVDDLSTRSFVNAFGTERMAYLQSYLLRLRRESFQVHHAMLDLSRSLRDFVRTRQFEEFRELADRLRRPQRLAAEVAGHVRAHQRLDTHLTLATFTPRSIGQLQLYSPSETTAELPEPPADVPTVDLEALRQAIRESEIDLVELTRNVDACLARRGCPVTIADVLADYPATQGLASVVGLLVLAHRHGETVPPDDFASGPQDDAPVSPSTQTIRWNVVSTGEERTARITALRFTTPLEQATHG